MNTELFIARKLHFRSDKENRWSRASRPAVRIAVIGTALGLSVMLVAVAVALGFKQEVSSKVIGFGAPVQITAFTNNNTFEMEPISFSTSLWDSLTQLPEVKSCSFYCTKPAILKTGTHVQGVVLKGVSAGYDWSFFAHHLEEGHLPQFADNTASTEVLLSRVLARRLGVNVGDGLFAYFIKEDVRLRKLQVAGIYNTGLLDFDQLFLPADIRLIQPLNGWDKDEVGGMEIVPHKSVSMNEAAEKVFEITANHFDRHGQGYYVRTISEMQPTFFGWLALLDMNVTVILILMMLVAGFTMISGLLILILDKTNLIGLLKAMGAKNRVVRRIFLYQAFFLILKGLCWGNVIGLGLVLAQKYLHLIPLNPNVYYVDTVPILLPLSWVVGLNVAVAVLSLLMLLLPSLVIAKISPARSIRFE